VFTFSSALSGVPNLAYGIKNYRGKNWLILRFGHIKELKFWSKKIKFDRFKF
jgi:hypothetical protein